MKKINLVIAAFLTISAVATGVTAAVINFMDVPQTHWAKDAVNWAQTNEIVQGYPDQTYRGDADISRYEMVTMLSKYNSELEEKMKMVESELNSTQNELKKSLLLIKPTSIEVVREIMTPDLAFPTLMNKAQAKKSFEFDDLYLTLVMMPSENLELTLPKDFKPTFKGVLVSGREDKQLGNGGWLTIKDNNKDSTGNNPYYLWAEGDKLLLSIVDENGAKDGEGVQKVYNIIQDTPKLEGCYAFAEVEDVMDPLAYSMQLAQLEKLSGEEFEACKDDVTLSW